MKNTILFCFFAWAIVSCSFPQPESQLLQTYFLTANPLVPKSNPAGARTRPSVLLVNLPRAATGFDTRKMVYVEKPYELNYYSKSQWADTLSRMLQPLLVQACESAGIWQAVIAMPTSMRGDYRVDIDDLELRQEFFQQPSRSRLKMRLRFIEFSSNRVVGSRLFEAVEDAQSEDAYGGTVAANRALAKLIPEVVKWLAACTDHSSEHRC